MPFTAAGSARRSPRPAKAATPRSSIRGVLADGAFANASSSVATKDLTGRRDDDGSFVGSFFDFWDRRGGRGGSTGEGETGGGGSSCDAVRVERQRSAKDSPESLSFALSVTLAFCLGFGCREKSSVRHMKGEKERDDVPASSSNRCKSRIVSSSKFSTLLLDPRRPPSLVVRFSVDFCADGVSPTPSFALGLYSPLSVLTRRFTVPPRPPPAPTERLDRR